MSERADESSLDERRIAAGVAIGLPLATLVLAGLAYVLMGMAMAILVAAGGLLLGVIALLWASLRVLSGDAPLSPELAALEVETHGVDALASRKKMLLVALRDLDNERALGKLDDEDFTQISQTYRAELKDVLRRIDESLAPHRGLAEDLVRSHLARAGLAENGYRGELPRKDAAKDDEPASSKRDAKDKKADKPARVKCPKCDASNEPDAKFCKECATALRASEASRAAEATEVSDDA